MALYNPNLNTASPDGPLEVTYPLLSQGDASTIELRQKYKQLSANYSPLALNTLFASGNTNVVGSLPAGASGARFMGDQNVAYEDGSIKTWERVWTTTPATRYDYQSISVIYPGYYDVRDPQTRVVNAQITTDYYLVGSPGGVYTDAGSIPLVAESNITNLLGMNIALLGGGEDAYLNNGGGVLSLTTPTLSGYLSTVSGDSSNQSNYSLVLESTLGDRYMGNIYPRITKRVKAK